MAVVIILRLRHHHDDRHASLAMIHSALAHAIHVVLTRTHTQHGRAHDDEQSATAAGHTYYS